MTSLDHTAFPHLFDAVLSHASRPALLSLRATSHHVRTLVDTRLCAHADLHLTAAPSWRLSSSGPLAGSLPLLPGDTRASCLSAIKTLTLRTPASQRRMARKDLLLPALYLPARTLRFPEPFTRLSIEGLAPEADSLVVFEDVGRSFNCDKTGWFFPPTVGGTRIPHWAARYVLNIGVRADEPELHAASWDAFAVLDDDGRPLAPGAPGREVVVILRGIVARAARPLQAAAHELGFLHGLAEAVRTHPEWEWTVVGAHEMLGVVPHAVPARAEVEAQFEETVGRAVRFVSLGEYARARGAEGVLELCDEA